MAKSPYKPTARDQLGKGAARKATKTVEDRVTKNADALAMARGIFRQGSDSQNSSNRTKKPVRR